MDATKSLDSVAPEGRVRKIRAYVNRILPSFLRRREGVTDIVQSAYVDYLDWAGKQGGRDGAARTGLLCRFAQRVVQRRKRWFGADCRYEPETPGEYGPEHMVGPDSVESSLEVAEKVALVQKALRLLGAEDRRVVEMRAMDDLPYAEVASRMGITEDAARMRFRRALARLGQLLQREAPDRMAAGG